MGLGSLWTGLGSIGFCIKQEQEERTNEPGKICWIHLVDALVLA
jgi:hypothetical protein